jgi:hypothetical protein
MSDSDINRVLGALEESKRQHTDQLSAIFRKLDDIQNRGCAKYPEHQDHEKRIRTMEDAKNVSKGELRGIVLTCSAVASVIGGALTLLVEWIRK